MQARCAKRPAVARRDADDAPPLSVAAYAALGLRAAMSRQDDALPAAAELAALVGAAGRHVSRDVADAMAADCAAAGEELARLESGAGAAAAREVARAAAAALPASRAAAVAAAHKRAALAQRRAQRKRDAADAEQRPHDAPPPALALAPELLALICGALDARALARAACVCVAWRAAASDDALWAPLYASVFGADARRGGALTWRGAFAAAAAAAPAAALVGGGRCACRRCGALTWRAQGPTRRAHALVPIAPRSAAARTLRAHGMPPPPGCADHSSDSEESSEPSSDGGEHEENLAASRRLWALPRGVAALRLR